MCLALTISLWTSLSFAQNQQKKATWRSITPLVSTLQEVEILLGPPTKVDGRNRYYDTAAGERVTIWYSGEPDNSSCKWCVPDDTVVRVIVTPRKRLFLSQIGFDLGGFEKRATIDEEVWDYVDEERGIFIETRHRPHSEPVIIFVEFLPTTKDKRGKCLSVK
jgi:hypothetical protein